MHTLKERLELEKRNMKPEEIKDLNLDNSKGIDIEGLSDEYVNLENLSLIHVGLQSLRGLPSLPALKKLELSDNNIVNGLDILVENCPQLEQLVLTNNKIKDLSSLEPLARLTKLTSLDLFSCAVTHSETFREDVFKLLPQLQYLDGFDAENQEEPDEEYEEEDDEDYDEGEVVEGVSSEDEEDDDEGSEFEKGPDDGDGESNHSGEPQPKVAHPSGKVGMNNHVHVGADQEDYSEEDEEEEGVYDEEENDAEVYDEEEELDDEEDDDEDDADIAEEDWNELSDPSAAAAAAAARGTKRKYPLNEDDDTGDSATNE